MIRLSVLSLMFYVYSVFASDLFHVNSKVTFVPDALSDYFGYSVLLSDMGLNVGAPKARSRINAKISPGLVFTCPLQDLDRTNITCDPIGNKDDRTRLRSTVPNDFYKDDMWFGATLAAIPSGKLLVCAPRITKAYQNHLLADGACYVRSKLVESAIFPLQDRVRLALRIDGNRPEYGEYGTHLNYYAYGQAGMSVKVTDNNRVIIGAPGVLQWTGSAVEYSFRPTSHFLMRGHWTNPYFTMNLGPDDYFGYSVDSGVFDESGTTLYVGGAPRSQQGYGQVILYDPAWTGENEPLKIKEDLVGKQLGSYFGASLCAVDLDGDGLSDLLVGAPNYVKRDGVLTYDQGAVFVYMNRKMDFRFHLQPAGYVGGSGVSGARFGTTIAQLGDLDADGYNDVAIGAPWENDGLGVVYIYKGNEYGLKNQYSQRIHAEGARGFGMSISKGYDVDNNNCNDLAVGAHNSATAYLYRSVPTIRVMSLIKVPDARNLKLNADNFTTLFCVTVPPNRSWPDVTIPLRAVISVDPEDNRAKSLSETEYTITAKSGLDICDEQIIQVNSSSDFSKPILLKFDLQPVSNLDYSIDFPTNKARLSEDSNVHSSFLIQLLSDCGEDLICTPWLEMAMEPLTSEYVPGEASRLGVKITVLNTKEPAYSVKLHVSLPCPPIRLPESCSLQNLDLICDLPAPLKRDQSIEWEIELQYTWDGSDEQLKIIAAIEDPVYSRNISNEAQEIVIQITPKSNYTVSGRSQPNTTITISREAFNNNENITFNHYYEVTNRGPSDLYHVEAIMELPKEATSTILVQRTNVNQSEVRFGISTLPANNTAIYILPMYFDFDAFGDELSEKLVLDVTSVAHIYLKNYHRSVSYNITHKVTTTLVLEPKTNLLLYLILSLLAGLLVLAAIILALYKFGFFSRTKKEELKQLLENNSSQEESGSSLCHSVADPSQATMDGDSD